MTEATPKRRWFRLSLRTLLLAITPLCVWLGIQANSARRQREAVNAIFKIGGEVHFDYQSVPPPPGAQADLALKPDATPPGPEWLRNKIGEDYFRNVISVALRGKTMNESDLKQLAKLRDVKVVFISQTKIVPEAAGSTAPSATARPIRDADLAVFENLNRLTSITVNDAEIAGSGLKSLVALPRLTSLGLVNSHVEDEGLEHVGELVNLKSLTLDGAKITDAGLVHLRELTNLESLSLSGANVSDNGLQHLNSNKLKLLMLRNTHVGDAALQRIGKIPALEILFLDGTNITDAGLAHLRGLTGLKTLTLGNTNVTDAGLQSLKDLKKLEGLSVPGTKVTSQGVRELQKALPTTEIGGP